MRVALLGNGWVVQPDTELACAGSDHYGHVVVWPGGLTYRPLAPGALRALLGERRFDVAPMTPAEIVTKEDIGKRIGIRTRKVDVATRAAKATFEIGRLPDLGEGGILLCRVLLDLMNAPPSSAVCADGELPVRAELRWTARGSIGFELTGVLKKADMSTSSLFVPPSSAAFAAAPLTATGTQISLSAPELAAFRTGPIDLPTAASRHRLGPRGREHDRSAARPPHRRHPRGLGRPGRTRRHPGSPSRPLHRPVAHVPRRELRPPTSQQVPGTLQAGGADAGK